MASYQTPISAIVKGALAGAAGTWVMSKAMERVPSLLRETGVPLPKAPRSPTGSKTPTEEVADGLAEAGEVGPLDEDERATAGQAIHWGYGAAWGAVYGIMQSSLRLPHIIIGTLFGALVGSVADTVMPRLGLQTSPAGRPPSLTVLYMSYHLIYGWATALAWAILNLGRRG